MKSIIILTILNVPIHKHRMTFNLSRVFKYLLTMFFSCQSINFALILFNLFLSMFKCYCKWNCIFISILVCSFLLCRNTMTLYFGDLSENIFSNSLVNSLEIFFHTILYHILFLYNIIFIFAFLIRYLLFHFHLTTLTGTSGTLWYRYESHLFLISEKNHPVFHH